MQTIDERLALAKARVNQLEKEKKLELRKERELKRKKEQQRNFIIGELVAKYFPQVLNLEPGTRNENATVFQPVDKLLSTLSTNQEFIKWVEGKMDSESFKK